MGLRTILFLVGCGAIFVAAEFRTTAFAKESCAKSLKLFGELWTLSEVEEFKEYQKTRSLDLLRKLQERYLHIVKPIASRIYQQNEHRFDYQELFDEGALGLAEAIIDYEESKSPSFIGYASNKIKYAILEHLNWEAKIPITRRRAYNLYQQAKNLIFVRTGDLYPDRESIERTVIEILSRGRKTAAQRVRAAREAMSLGSSRPFEKLIVDVTDESLGAWDSELFDVVIDYQNDLSKESPPETKESAEDEVWSTSVNRPFEYHSNRQGIFGEIFEHPFEYDEFLRRLFEPLNERERQIAIFHYGLGLNAAQIGLRLGLTEGNARIARTKVIHKIQVYGRKLFSRD